MGSVLMLWALYPFIGFTMLPFLTGHTTRVELVLIALFWPACWVLVVVMGAVALVRGWRWQ